MIGLDLITLIMLGFKHFTPIREEALQVQVYFHFIIVTIFLFFILIFCFKF